MPGNGRGYQRNGSVKNVKTLARRFPTLLTIIGSVAGGAAIFFGNLSTIREEIVKLFSKETPNIELNIRDPRVANSIDMPATPVKFWLEVVVEKSVDVELKNCVQWIVIDGLERHSDMILSFGKGAAQKLINVPFEWKEPISGVNGSVRIVCDNVITPWKEFETSVIRSKSEANLQQKTSLPKEDRNNNSDIVTPETLERRRGDTQGGSEAAMLFRKAAEQGSATAQLSLALLYEKGQGVPKDYSLALAWYRKAAEQGNGEALYKIALLYENGEGVPKDYSLALEWYREAAERGNGEALYKIALLYENGRGVEQDYRQASAWFRRAAEHGNVDAQNSPVLFKERDGPLELAMSMNGDCSIASGGAASHNGITCNLVTPELLAKAAADASEKARLEEAVSVYREALTVTTRESAPLAWAATQNNLGNALLKLGQRDNGTEPLDEAVAAYREALKVRTRESAPLDWATTQNYLGNALLRLGERDNGTAQLDEAAAAYREALKVRTRESAPLDWATTQNNLGNALLRLGERDSGTAQLDEAVQVYSAALTVTTRERSPGDWATIQSNLATAFRMLGERFSAAERLAEARTIYSEALTIYKQVGNQLGQADVQRGLGYLESRLGHYEAARAAYGEAAELYKQLGLQTSREAALAAIRELGPQK